MDKFKFFGKALLGFAFIMLTCTLAFAERDCTRQVVRSDGTVDITVDCSSSYQQTSENFTNRYLFETLIENLKNSVSWGMQDLEEKYSALFSSQDKAKQFAYDTQEKEQSARDSQQIKLLGQETQMQDLKDRQEYQKEQQEALQDRISAR